MPVPHLDHIVVATTDLPTTVVQFEAATGIRPEPGGVHPDHGTRNSLVSLGNGAYLEMIGIDPELPPPPGDERVFDLHLVTRPKVATWAVHPPDPEASIKKAAARNLDLGASVQALVVALRATC